MTIILGVVITLLITAIISKFCILNLGVQVKTNHVLDLSRFVAFTSNFTNAFLFGSFHLNLVELFL